MTKRQKNWRQWAIVTLLVGCAVTGAWSVLSWQVFADPESDDSPSDADSIAFADELVPVARLDASDSFDRSVVHTGTMQAKNRTMVAFPRGGKIDDLLVDLGQRVSRSQNLAVLDSRHLRAERSVLDAQLAQAQSVLAELQRGPRVQAISAQKDVVADLEQQLSAQKLKADRSQSLLKSNAIARQDYEQDLYTQRALEARLSAARNRLEELSVGTRIEQIEAQQATVNSIIAQQQALQYNLDDCQLQAPFSGIITERFMDPGAVIQPGTPVYELVDDRNLEVHIGVPESMLRELQPGSVYDLVANNVRMKATLRTVLPQLDSTTRTCRAVLDVVLGQGENPGVAVGQLVKVEFNQTIAEPGFWMPRLALTADHSGLWSCYVVQLEHASEPSENGRTLAIDSGTENGGLAGRTIMGVVKKHSVEVIFQKDEQVYVRGTVSQGQWLVCEGVHTIVPGQKIRGIRVESPGSRFENDFGVTIAPERSPNTER